jgi:hypothetical protein
MQKYATARQAAGSRSTAPIAAIGPPRRGVVQGGAAVGRSSRASAIDRCTRPPNRATSSANTRMSTPM